MQRTPRFAEEERREEREERRERREPKTHPSRQRRAKDGAPARRMNWEMSGCAEIVRAAASRTPKVMREESWKVR